MGTFLKVLVVFILVLSIGALVLGILLFNKRELLKARAQMLEKYVASVSATIESEPPRMETKPEYPAKDVDECTAEIIQDPAKSQFWNTYSNAYELSEQPTMNLNTSRRQLELMSYYKRDPMGSILRDPVKGFKITEGKGTMHDLLEEVLSNAQAQYDLLSATRQQLIDLRNEYIATVEELNQRKAYLRDRLHHIVELNQKIDELNREIDRLNRKIRDLESQIESLQVQIADLNREIERLQEEKADLELDIEHLKQENNDLRKQLGMEIIVAKPVIDAGTKGEVVSVNPDWHYAVVKLNDEFLQEILGEFMDKDPPKVELYIKRAEDDELVSKARLIQVRRKDKLGVVDILTDWQQAPVREGDTVFYQAPAGDLRTIE
ncbi:MAG: hypothetical protein R6V03_09435 [Kiritimatiellia bacterium]